MAKVIELDTKAEKVLLVMSSSRLSGADLAEISQRFEEFMNSDRKSIVVLDPDSELTIHRVPKLIEYSKENSLNAEQPMPARLSAVELPAIWDLVIADMRERDERGTAIYGTRLQPFNGRDSEIDAYQEALDLVVYLRQRLYERDGK